MALPFEQEPLGEELFDNPTFIRPLIEAEKDALFQSLYADSLADYICPELAQENLRLRRQLSLIHEALDETDYD